MRVLTIVADDRTGALETAGACAAGGHPAVVRARTGRRLGQRHRVVVVDIDSRHCSPAEASQRAISAEPADSAVRAHKMDSTLRGNWAHELVARQRHSGGRVLIVPALPQLDRACRGGVVSIAGRPVAAGQAGQDAIDPVRSSRPADYLHAAGLGPTMVTHLAGMGDLNRWLDTASAPFAVCDATTDADLAAIAGRWASATEVLFAGTSAAIAAAAVALHDHGGPPIPRAFAPALVVCGSLHPGARVELAQLPSDHPVTLLGADLGPLLAALRAGTSGVLASPWPAATRVSADEAMRVAHHLAAIAHEVLAAVAVPTVVLIGGDTAAAFLGRRAVRVDGLLAPGTPVGRLLHGTGSTLVTRAGGFGEYAPLPGLLSGMMKR